MKTCFRHQMLIILCALLRLLLNTCNSIPDLVSQEFRCLKVHHFWHILMDSWKHTSKNLMLLLKHEHIQPWMLSVDQELVIIHSLIECYNLRGIGNMRGGNNYCTVLYLNMNALMFENYACPCIVIWWLYEARVYSWYIEVETPPTIEMLDNRSFSNFASYFLKGPMNLLLSVVLSKHHMSFRKRLIPVVGQAGKQVVLMPCVDRWTSSSSSFPLSIRPPYNSWDALKLSDQMIILAMMRESLVLVHVCRMAYWNFSTTPRWCILVFCTSFVCVMISCELQLFCFGWWRNQNTH